MRCVFLVSMLALSACSDPGFNIPRTAVMQNPKTGEVAQCHHDSFDTFNAGDIDSCINGYKKAGWVSLSEGS